MPSVLSTMSVPVRYTPQQLKAYAKHVQETIVQNERFGTDYTPHPITNFKWDNCVICDKMIMDDVFGNNPYPVKQDGSCCSKCNREVVIPARVASMFAK